MNQGRAAERHEPGRGSPRQAVARGDRQPHRGEPAGLVRVAREDRGQLEPDSRHRREHRDPVRLGGAERPARAARARRQHGRGPRREGPHEADEQAERGRRARGRVAAVAGAHAGEVAQEARAARAGGAMDVCDALGPARGTRGVDEQGDLAVADVRRRLRLAVERPVDDDRRRGAVTQDGREALRRRGGVEGDRDGAEADRPQERLRGTAPVRQEQDDAVAAAHAARPERPRRAGRGVRQLIEGHRSVIVDHRLGGAPAEPAVPLHEDVCEVAHAARVAGRGPLRPAPQGSTRHTPAGLRRVSRA